MSDFKRVVHCGIDFNLMESGDQEYREKCLKHWLQENCSGSYSYTWSFADEFTITFESEADYTKSAVLLDKGIPSV